MPYAVMAHDIDPKDAKLDELGDIDGVEIFNNQVLVAVYIKPDKTRGGIILPGSARDEDKYQGKIGLVVKRGPSAFDDAFRSKFSDVEVDIGDWAIFRPSDGWSVTINDVLCRILDDVNIRGRVQHPDQVW